MNQGFPVDLLIETLPLLDTASSKGYQRINELAASLEKEYPGISKITTATICYPLNSAITVELRCKALYSYLCHASPNFQLLRLVAAFTMIITEQAFEITMIGKDSFLYSLYDLIIKKREELKKCQQHL